VVEVEGREQQYGPLLCDVALLELVLQLLQFGLQLGVRLGHGVVAASMRAGSRDRGKVERDGMACIEAAM
jgi:hypothetical protein